MIGGKKGLAPDKQEEQFWEMGYKASGNLGVGEVAVPPGLKRRW